MKFHLPVCHQASDLGATWLGSFVKAEADSVKARTSQQSSELANTTSEPPGE